MVHLYLEKKFPSHSASVLVQAHVLGLAEASVFVPNMLLKHPVISWMHF